MTGPTSVFDDKPMTLDDAATLEARMAEETPAYIAHFLGFSQPGQLREQVSRARRDAFFSIFSDGALSGFYCLRGLDAGFARPSFGVYVASSSQGRGLARSALESAVTWCAARSIPVLMLKVSPDNHIAQRIYLNAQFIPKGTCPDTLHTIMERVTN